MHGLDLTIDQLLEQVKIHDHADFVEFVRLDGQADRPVVSVYQFERAVIKTDRVGGGKLATDRYLIHRLYFDPMSDAKQPDVGGGPIIGIDLGTTNSLVAYCDASGPRMLADDEGRVMLPSVVRFDPSRGGPPGACLDAIGHAARAHAIEYPGSTIFSAKRLMGRGIEDMADELAYLPYEVVAGEHNTARVRISSEGGGTELIVSPPQISALILLELRRYAEARLGVPVRRAVVTVPAYFDDAQRQATRDAGRIAGLDVLRIVNEPTAAALAYNLGQRHDDATVAVYDLGGGTFDISILRLQLAGQTLVDQVLATDGNTHLGGDDVDRMIIELIQREIRAQFFPGISGKDADNGAGSFTPATLQAMRNFAEATKIKLSTDERADIEIDLPGVGRYQRTITRGEFEQMIAPWVDRTIDCCRRALQSAGLETADIERVILVGGSTRIPMVRNRVSQWFDTQVYTALDPDQVVALGAAAQASILAGINRDMLLLDVIPLSLGIETMGGAVAKIITANTTIPARVTEMFSTYVDEQTNVNIHVLQGERELVKDCRSLGQFDLRGIPAMPAGLPKIEVTFLVDANGILSVTAVERRSEKAAQIQIVPNHGLTRQEVSRMEAQSVAHAKQDMAAHQLIDLRNQSRMDVRAIERQLAKVGDEIGDDYRGQIEAHVAAVRQLLDMPDPDPTVFHEALDTMDKAAVRLAEIAIRQSLREGSSPM